LSNFPETQSSEEIKMRAWKFIAGRLLGLVFGLALGLAGSGAAAQDLVVYHIDDAATQGLKGLRNIKNHLDTDAAAQVTVVTHANGVDFLFTDAMDRNGNPYEIAVQELVRRGVKFEVCEITLKNRNLKKTQFIQEAAFTPSGVVRLAKLQRQGAAYIKP
jgi:intracellular sulfur oxidation DsrE/DsrF family protein